MTEDVKSKKLRIYKFAAEYNLSADMLVEFLQKRGYEVKSHMSPLTDEMMADIANHYKKDIEKAEKHYRKISEFNKKRAEKTEESAQKEEVQEDIPFAEEPYPAEEQPEVPSSGQSVETPAVEEAPAAVSEETAPAPEAAKEELPAEAPAEIPEAKEVQVPQKETQAEETREAEAPAQPEEKAPKPQPQAPAAEEETPAEKVPAERAVSEKAPDEKPVQEKPIAEKPSTEKPTAEKPVTPPAAPVKPAAEEKPVVEKPVAEKPAGTPAPAAEKTRQQTPEVKVFKTQSERELARNKGLTIVGKIDLEREKRERQERQRAAAERAKSGKKEEDRPQRSERPERRERPAQQQFHAKGPLQQQQQANAAVPLAKNASSQQEADQAKKKKKKPKTKKKVGKEGQPEESSALNKKKKFKRVEVDKKDVDAAIKRTLLSFDDSSVAGRASVRKKKKKEKLEEQERLQEERELSESTKIKVTEFIAVNELANLMNVSVSDVIAKCIGLGIMVSINQRLDVETITLVADEFGYEVEFEEEYTSEELEDIQDDPETLKSRPPVVTIMGHVDHGKTSLLDRIRSSNVVAGESGGITQHIGAYQVEVASGKFITFLDTPGHEAFTAMRARGAKVTDIVVLIVAADDAVMPQTVEAINHAQAAGVPIIIAINKIDKPGANPDKIRQQLADRNILVEDWGGRYQCVEISAKANINIEELLEKILLESELLELKANPDRQARGTVIESQLDKGRGITGTILVQKGTLKVGDPFVSGVYYGRVRAMFDERNRKIDTAPPSTPVLVLGFEGAPQAGDTFVVVNSERDAREISLKRQQLKREQDQRQIHHITLDEIARQISIGGVKELPLIVKGDVDGSVEALSDSLMKLSNEEVLVQVIHKGVGGISEGDVLLAAASGAIIIGFHVRPNLNARKLAENEKVDIRLYNVIYDAINEVKSALEGLLSPVISEEVVATIEVRDTFKVPKVGTVAGCYVQEGKVMRTNKIRLIRQGIVVHDGELASLRRFKDDVKEVDAGYECGLNINNFNDIKVGDIIEAYKIVETKKKLA
ncbi:MAG: translation initiation factor IF-2 [Ignavibacteria bacterium]|jgi:translation initiation factor IF-2|nr:translation initiation factor IF-2 [Ignavibacteria bacterium]MCU7515189.1 translation initiation factor IF-2 [Ignavibacteria bacterium]